MRIEATGTGRAAVFRQGPPPPAAAAAAVDFRSSDRLTATDNRVRDNQHETDLDVSVAKFPSRLFRFRVFGGGRGERRSVGNEGEPRVRRRGEPHRDPTGLKFSVFIVCTKV